MIGDRNSTRLIMAALATLAGYQVLCVASIVGLMTSPSGGWVFWETEERAIRVEPATTAAVKVASKHKAPLLLEGLNGHPVARGEDAEQIGRLLDLQPMAQNRYVLRDGAGQQVDVTLPVARPTPAAFGEEEAGGILSVLYHLLGIGFLLVGFLVWRKRRGDPAAHALLLFGLVAAFHMAEVYPHDQLSRVLLTANMFFKPLFAPAGLHLAMTFTDQGSQRLLRFIRTGLISCALVIGALLSTATYLSVQGQPWVTLMEQGAHTAASTIMLFATPVCFATCLRVARSDASSLLQGLRAREMARAMGLPLIIPCLWQLCRPHVDSVQVTIVGECAQLASLAAFPLMVGNAFKLTELAARLHQAQCQLMDAETQAVLTRFIAGIVHEINSPLGVLASGAGTIGRAVEILGDPQLRAETLQGRAARRVSRAVEVSHKTVQTMEAANGRIRALLGNLQRSISLDAAEYKALDLREGLEDALQLLTPELEGRITLMRELPQAEVMVSCYPARLNRILLSLLQNAVESIDDRGEVKLTMRSDAERVHIEIADTGRGIPPDKLATLFEFGFTKKTGRIGLGMGLASTRRLVQQMNGEIRVDSTVGQGTTVYLILPRVCPHDTMTV